MTDGSVLEVHSGIAVLIVLNSVLIQEQFVDGIQVGLDGRILRLVISNDLPCGSGIVPEQGVCYKELCLDGWGP